MWRSYSLSLNPKVLLLLEQSARSKELIRPGRGEVFTLEVSFGSPVRRPSCSPPLEIHPQQPEDLVFKPYRLFAVSLLAAPLLAQDSTATVKGRLMGGDESSLNGYFIELSNLSSRVTFGRIDVSFGGDFMVRAVPFGDYLARVTTYHGDAVAQQFVNINQSITPIDLKLPGRPPAPSGGTVSARELRSPPRRQAVDAWLAAQRFSASGKFGQAATELEKAVKISGW